MARAEVQGSAFHDTKKVPHADLSRRGHPCYGVLPTIHLPILDIHLGLGRFCLGLGFPDVGVELRLSGFLAGFDPRLLDIGVRFGAILGGFCVVFHLILAGLEHVFGSVHRIVDPLLLLVATDREGGGDYPDR